MLPRDFPNTDCACPQGFGIEWNAEKQLVRVTRDCIEVARFGYDPLGRRVEKVAGTTTTSYSYSSEDILREDTGGITVRYVHGPGIDEPLGVENSAGQLQYEHADGLGSELKRTDGSGATTLTRSYEAFGEPGSGAATSGYAYTGREWDPETGLYYYRARYYDPKAGRFVSEDPIGHKGGVNFYAYVENRPVDRVDPSGLLGDDTTSRPTQWDENGRFCSEGACIKRPTSCAPRCQQDYYKCWKECFGWPNPAGAGPVLTIGGHFTRIGTPAAIYTHVTAGACIFVCLATRADGVCIPDAPY